jgi:uncharacterized protein (TIGR00661 family)
MRILYGVVGEGMGHATRSRVILEHLLERGHRIRVVVSGRAHTFLREMFDPLPGIEVVEIQGLSLSFDGPTIDVSETVLSNLESLPAKLRANLKAYLSIAEDGFKAQAVISDFESWAYFYARNHRIPVVSIDNMQVINRCEHPAEITEGVGFDFRLSRTIVKAKLPGAYHYLATTFFTPRVRKKRTTLVPPILRPQVLDAKSEPGDHVLVYQTAAVNEDLLELLHELPGEFRVYGLHRDERIGNVVLRPFSEIGFLDDLRTARAVIATGGFSLMSEAVHLRVPLLAVPLEGQFEQELNSRWLARLGYGSWTPTLTGDVVLRFLARVDDHARSLQAYQPRDNSMTLACVDELLARIENGEGRPARLIAPALAKWGGTG